ncbi:hypothetical protein [Rheinheimera sp.]|uniref:hypothetical protein n=1 Tax=Rheinheimera sp. TaxID=1869214 RepID=UPI002FDCF1A8
MKKTLVLLYLVLALGCASTKNSFVFDGSTAKSTEQGVVYMSKRLKPEQQIEFMTALMAIQFYDVHSALEVIDDPTMINQFNYEVIGKKIHGLTYNQVLALAKTSPTKVSVTEYAIGNN